MAPSEISLEAAPSAGDIPAADWDACANPEPRAAGLDQLDTLASTDPSEDSCVGPSRGYNPFVSHAFFSAAEASGSACARTGWGPRHLLAKLDGPMQETHREQLGHLGEKKLKELSELLAACRSQLD